MARDTIPWIGILSHFGRGNHLLLLPTLVPKVAFAHAAALAAIVAATTTLVATAAMTTMTTTMSMPPPCSAADDLPLLPSGVG